MRRFVTALASVNEVLGTQPLSEVKIHGYFLALQDFTIEQIEQACGLALGRFTFMPRPVEIRELLEGHLSDRPALAWQRLMNAIRHHGGSVSVDFQDEVLHVVIESLGGWDRLASDMPSDPKEQRFIEANFVKLYAVTLRKILGTVPSYLPGRFEIENRDRRGTFSRGPADYHDEVLRLGADGQNVLDRRPALPGGPKRLRVEMGKLLPLRSASESSLA